MNRLKTRLGEAAILLAAVLWGCISLFSRSMTAHGFTPTQMVAVRAVFTTLILAVLLLIKDPKLFRIRLRDLWMFLGSGICSFLFFNVCYMNSLVENSVSVACILMYTSPFWVLFLSIPIFKEKFTVKRAVSLAIAFVGCVFVSISPTLTLTKLGLLFGLLSGFGYALYSIFGKLAAGRYHTMTITFYTFLFAVCGVLPLCDAPALLSLMATPKNTLWSLGIAVFETILPYLLYTYGLSKTAAGKAAVLCIAEPVVAALVGAFIFSEYMGPLGILGILLVAIGLCILEQPTHKNKGQ